MKTWTRILALSLTMFLISNCGEGFRGNNAAPEGSIFEDGASTQGLGRESLSAAQNKAYLDILRSYRSELEGKKTSAIAVTADITAFDVIVTRDRADSVVLTARVANSCSDGFSVSKRVQNSQARPGVRLSLGQDGPYNIEVQCMKTCNNLVAAIRKTSGGNQGTVLVALRPLAKIDDQSIIFDSMDVGIASYYANFQSIPKRYSSNKSCSVHSLNGQNEAADEGPTSLKDAVIDSIEDAVEEKIREEAEDVIKDLWEDTKDFFGDLF